MTIPAVQFPIAQADIKPAVDKLKTHIELLATEAAHARTLLNALMSICDHSKMKGNKCPECGFATHADYLD